MIYTLENDQAILKVDTKACEIASFRRKDKDIEYMWNGDPAYWTGRNPVLFPHVSAPKNKILNFKGKDFKVGNHGFARRSEFTFLKQTRDTLSFLLEDSEKTYEEYPYHFRLQVDYRLDGAEAEISYSISSSEDIVFGFGLHPAFNCPLAEGRSFDDYRVEFDADDVEERRLDLSYGLFDRYPTYVVDKVKSRSFLLTDGENGVRLRTGEGFNIFALWTPHAPFVCLEPWVGEIDASDETTPFEQREGNIHLPKGATFDIRYSIELV